MTPALGRVHMVTAGHLRDAESHVTDSHIGRTDYQSPNLSLFRLKNS